MKALSLWQPHAMAIGVGIKRYETRAWMLPRWAMNIPIAIHAAKKPFAEKDFKGDDEWVWYKTAVSRLKGAGVRRADLDYGKIVCICTFTECLRMRDVRLRDGTPRVGDKADEPAWFFWGDFNNRDEDTGNNRFAFKIEDVKLIPKEHRPAIAGRQGFFDVPDEIGLWVA